MSEREPYGQEEPRSEQAGGQGEQPGESRSDQSEQPGGQDVPQAEPAGETNEPLIGRESTVVAGRFGEPLTVEHAVFSRGTPAPRRPMFLCLHGWGSNEDDLVDLMRFVAPYNDYVSLRAPLTLQRSNGMVPGAYSWLHDAVPSGDDLDYDAFAAAQAIDAWVEANIAAERDVVPFGFSQGGMLAIHLLRIHPERYRAVISLSGFVARGGVPGTAPADARLAEREIPVFYGYGARDNVVPASELRAAEAWLEEHTWLTSKCYRGLDHAVNLEELSDIQQWLITHDIASGVM